MCEIMMIFHQISVCVSQKVSYHFTPKVKCLPRIKLLLVQKDIHLFEVAGGEYCLRSRVCTRAMAI